MEWVDLFSRRSKPPVHRFGHIVDDRQIVSVSGARYLAFHLSEGPGTELHLRIPGAGSVTLPPPR